MTISFLMPTPRITAWRIAPPYVQSAIVGKRRTMTCLWPLLPFACRTKPTASAPYRPSLSAALGSPSPRMPRAASQSHPFHTDSYTARTNSHDDQSPNHTRLHEKADLFGNDDDGRMVWEHRLQHERDKRCLLLGVSPERLG